MTYRTDTDAATAAGRGSDMDQATTTTTERAARDLLPGDLIYIAGRKPLVVDAVFDRGDGTVEVAYSLPDRFTPSAGWIVGADFPVSLAGAEGRVA